MPTTVGSRLDQAKNDLVERAISSGGGEHAEYVRQYYRHVAPEDVLGGQYSLPFTTAVALTRDLSNPLVYDDAQVGGKGP